MTRMTTLITAFTANENLVLDGRAHTAIEQWNKAGLPICPGLGQTRLQLKKQILPVTSDSYCSAPEPVLK